jgi:hypothetical protein
VPRRALDVNRYFVASLVVFVLLVAGCDKASTPSSRPSLTSPTPPMPAAGRPLPVLSACSAHQFHLSVIQGASGGLILYARNIGRPCELQGVPRVVGFDKAGRQIATMAGVHDGGVRVRVMSHRTAYAGVAINTSGSSCTVAVRRLNVKLASGMTAANVEGKWFASRSQSDACKGTRVSPSQPYLVTTDRWNAARRGD